ncbi:MAG: hypothetical protein L3K03_02710, partial [Thermoplasmata archaeon]|nr:hypothetical protein [Thermoplasmata archaeon]
VTPQDYELLEWSTDHLPNGSTVLVAPGSAAEFLPSSRPDVHLLYPMAYAANNGTYRAVVTDLSAGVLTDSDFNDLWQLHVQYILVTGANTVLWPPFLPGPLANSSDFAELFHEGDAYAFEGPLAMPPSLPP